MVATLGEENTFKKQREEIGYSRADVGKELGRHRNTVRYWELGIVPLPKFARDWMAARHKAHKVIQNRKGA